MQADTRRERMLVWSLPVIAPLLATLVAWLLSPIVPRSNFAMIYLAGVLLTAMSTRVRPAIVCALLSFLAYNFFHTAPHYTLFMVDQDDILTAGLFVLVALVTGQLAARLKEKVVSLEVSNRWHQQQIAMASELAGCVDRRQVVTALDQQITRYFGITPHTLYRSSTAEIFERLHPEQEFISLSFAEFDGDEPVALQELNNTWRITLRESEGGLAVLLIVIPESSRDWQRTRLEALLGLVRLAWERVRLENELRQETVVKEREQLRSALLSSISHDLRTPLATMIGSVSSVIDLYDALTPAQRRELLTNTLSEARRLDGYIQKLLDMTRLGHGELTLDRAWVGIDDILSVVLKRAKPLANAVELKLSPLPELPLLYVHPALIEQALFNVLENAIRFAPEGSAIEIHTQQADGLLLIDVHDQGPGIPQESWDSIFDMFFTFSHGDQYPGGAGLGLAICRGILGAHGGSVQVVASSPHTGTTIRLSIPLPQPEFDAVEVNP
tara:strand:+ start:8868 stop:10364 length:1497 start_codon:yes stop_codon:yes gene_type:complete